MNSSFSLFRRLALTGVIASAAALVACAATTPAPMAAPSRADGASVRFLAPADGATVTSPFMVKFGVTGLAVKSAGEEIENTKAGHHHVLINMDAMTPGESIPFTEKHIHFGKGQTEAEVKLAPGTYKLTMQFGNGAHQSYGKDLSHSITVTVK